MDPSPGILSRTGRTPPAMGPEAGLTPSAAATIQTPPWPGPRLQGQNWQQPQGRGLASRG